MSDGKIHGTDCFEVDSFLQKNGTSKLYQVRRKENGKFYTMEVSPREATSKAPVSPYVQHTRSVSSKFWVNLRFTFQTRTKFYYILDHAGSQTLSQLLKSNDCFPESIARFYASELLVCLEEFHNCSLVYKELELDSVYVDSEGHVVIWRSFCGKKYWSKRECVCSLNGFRHGDPCNNNHDLQLKAEFKHDWKSLGNLLYTMLTGESYHNTQQSNTKQSITLPNTLSASANDLIRRLVRGDVSRSEQIQSHPFFKGVDWYEVRKRRSRAPSFPPNFRSKQVASSFDSPSSYSSVPSTQGWRPHSLSHYSDPGDLRYQRSAPDYLAPRPSLHSAVSTPDLSSWGREPPTLHHHSSYPVSDMRHRHEVPGYPNDASRDFQPTTERGRERKVLVSRSLSDLTNFGGNEEVFYPRSPTSFQRTFENVHFEGAPMYGSAQDLRRTGSQTDLSGSYGSPSPPFYGSYSGRSSPTPSQYSDYSSYSSYSTDTSPRRAFESPNQSPRARMGDSGFSHAESGYSPRENGGAFGYRRRERSSSRESEDDRGGSGSPSGSPNKFSMRSSEPRPIEYSSPRSEFPSYRSSTQQRHLANSAKESSELTRRDDVTQTSNDVGRPRTISLSRTLSCSNLGDENKRLEPKQVSNQRRDSLPLTDGGLREKYPLAQLPIPSFREFKKRNSNGEVERNSEVDRGRKEVSASAPKTGSKTDDKARISKPKKAEERAPNLQKSLSSLYESAKDISGHSKAKRLSGSGKGLNVPDKFKTETPLKKNVAESHETKSSNAENVNDGKNSRKISKSRQESPFSKNEVIHQLMMKYGLYEKGGQRKAKSPTSERKSVSPDSGNSEVKERSKVGKSDSKSPSSRRRISPRVAVEKGSLSPRGNTDAPNSPGTTRSAKSSPQSARKIVESAKEEHKKSASERLKELRKKNGFVDDAPKTLEASRDLTQASTKQRTSAVGPLGMNRSETASQEKENELVKGSSLNDKRRSSDHRKNDLDSTMSEILKAKLAVIRNRAGTKETPIDKTDNLTSHSDSVAEAKRPSSMYNTSRTILAAAKFKRAKNKSGKFPSGSPLPDKKQFEQIIVSSDVSGEFTNRAPEEAVERMTENNNNRTDTITINGHSPSIDQTSPSTRRQRFRHDKNYRKSGIHTSMLSVASSFCSTDTDMDDTISICSEIDSLDGERGTRGRRWDSFYSNISADSGSAQLFEYETDSAAMEFDEVFDDQESGDEHPKGEVDVERADSGVGGDMGQGPLRRSWEEIMMKSSEHWSVVAASARHWQEMARRKRADSGGTSQAKKKSSTSITEDMVECPDCLKHYIPLKEKETATDPEICSKCKDRRVERKEAIIELVQTEINYGNDLQILKEEFYVPMQSGGILSPENLAAIFLNLQELLEVNSKFCAKLQKSLEESVAKGDEEFSKVNVGSIFLESVDFFQAYEIYCSKQNAASALLDSLQKKAELLRIFLNVTCRENPKCRKMDLNSFILAPVQRIMKYPLLLSRICKASPRRNTDREKLKVAQRKIEEQLNKINALNTTVESRQKRYRASQQLGRSDSLDKLQMKKMASDILNWTMEEMQLLMHGVFQITIHEFGTSWNRRGSKKAMSVCVLFCVRGHLEHVRIDSDEEGECEEPLFPGEGEVTDASLVLLRKKINGKYTLFREPLFLDMCVVYRDCERKDAFEIVLMGKESYIFRASTSREFRRWLKYLRIESKNLGTWKRRRNGLPNIMIKNL